MLLNLNVISYRLEMDRSKSRILFPIRYRFANKRLLILEEIDHFTISFLINGFMLTKFIIIYKT